MKNKTPIILDIRKSDRKDYDLLKDKDSPFAGKGNKELFLMAMIIGFRNGTRVKLDTRDTFARIEYLNSKEKSIIKAIAVAEDGDLNVLLDKKKFYSIAEEYAAGGIKLLKEKVFGGEPGNYFKKLESDLLDDFKKIDNTIK